MKKGTAEILARAASMLNTASIGALDLGSHDPSKRLAGLQNLVVFGRAVTNVLQNLRSTEAAFDDWYRPFVDEMSADPLMKFFYNLRSKILKQGALPRATVLRTGTLTIPPGPPPPNATDSFIDASGGVGWHITLPDGTTGTLYVPLPATAAQVNTYLLGAPTHHLGQDLGTTDAVVLANRYLDYLRNLIAQAQARFSPASGESGGA